MGCLHVVCFKISALELLGSLVCVTSHLISDDSYKGLVQESDNDQIQL